MTESGLTLAQAMKQQADRGPLAVRPLAARMTAKLERGGDLQTALEAERSSFPPLFHALSAVGENTGKLPEVLGELEDYFALQQRLRRQFLIMIAWPAVRFVFAVLVLTLLIWILGVIADARGDSPVSVFGWKGGKHALLFLGSIAGFFALLGGLYWFAGAVLKSRPAVDRFLLGIPVLGNCLRMLAVSRFSLGLYLTTEAGTPIADALRLSLHATGNAAFADKSAGIEHSVRQGDEITAALQGRGLFPEEYLSILETAEVSGKIPEVMRKQAQHYHEEAARSLQLLTGVAGGLVWLAVAAFIVFFIFQLARMYFGILDSLTI